MQSRSFNEWDSSTKWRKRKFCSQSEENSMIHNSVAFVIQIKQWRNLAQAKKFMQIFSWFFPTSQQYDKFSEFFFLQLKRYSFNFKIQFKLEYKMILNLVVNQKLNDESKLEKNCSIVSDEKFVSQLTSRSYFFFIAQKKNAL